jgi:hypothetical protein
MTQDDYVYVQASAAGLPYCAIVVPDRQWAHQARSVGQSPSIRRAHRDGSWRLRGLGPPHYEPSATARSWAS